MLNSLANSLHAILNAGNRENLLAAMQEACSRLGFVTFNLSHDKTSPEGFMTRPTITSWSDQDIGAYLDDGFMRVDPLLKHLSRDNTPLFWDCNFQNIDSPPEYAELIRHHGIQGGATIPLPASPDHFSAVTFLTFAEPPAERELVLTLARIVGHTALSRMSHLGHIALRADAVSARLRSLTGKQREILHWIAEGKTNHEIAVILGLPRRQVDYHGRQIFEKLGVTNRIKAAVIYASR